MHETGKNNSAKSNRGVNHASLQQVPAIDNNHYDTQNIVNNVANEMVSEGLQRCWQWQAKYLNWTNLQTLVFG